jgi:hypothetical protein
MKTKLFRANLLILVVLTSLSLGASAQEKITPEAYTGVAIGTGGSVGGRSASFDFRITSYTTDDELASYAQLLKDKGQNALTDTLWKQDKGRFNLVGSTGNEIAVARKRQQGEKTIITIVTARKMSFTELRNSGRSVDYPFGFMQVTLDANGKGTGQIMAAAKIRFDKKSGKYEIESYGNQYIKATNVRPNN